MWRGQIIETSDNVVTMGITPASDCIVGKYRMHVAVVTPYGIRRTKRDPTSDTYILFNPWSPGQKSLICCSKFKNLLFWLCAFSVILQLTC